MSRRFSGTLSVGQAATRSPAYTIAAEIGDIHRYSSPRKLAGHTA